MREKVLEILSRARDDIEYENETALIDDGLLDSFDIIAIVSDFNEAFGINITADELEPENFNSIDAMVQLISSMK